MTRRGEEAVHFLQHSFEVGQTVSVLLDWTRRLDHMQQHSGDVPFISAVTNKVVRCVFFLPGCFFFIRATHIEQNLTKC